MHQSTKDKKYSRNRKPIIVLVCEGKNKTERTYFNNFVNRNANYRLYIKDSEATDIEGMAKRALFLYNDYQIDKSSGDAVFCLVDLDLSQSKAQKYLKLIKSPRYKNINFIISNPCFEIWLMYYFTDNPKVLKSSQKVKEEMRKFLKDYDESMDVVKCCNLYDKHAVAINRSDKKNVIYREDNTPLIDRNPYSEVQDLLDTLLK